MRRIPGGIGDRASQYPDAVLADLKAKLEECTKAGGSDCVVHCSYAIKQIDSFLHFPTI